MIDWDAHRRADGSIDLWEAFVDMMQRSPYSRSRFDLLDESSQRAKSYLLLVESIQPIKSRQAAALAIATAVLAAIEYENNV